MFIPILVLFTDSFCKRKLISTWFVFFNIVLRYQKWTHYSCQQLGIRCINTHTNLYMTTLKNHTVCLVNVLYVIWICLNETTWQITISKGCLYPQICYKKFNIQICYRKLNEIYETLTRKFMGSFYKTILLPRSVLRPTFDIRSHHNYFIKLSYLNWLMIILKYVLNTV